MSRNFKCDVCGKRYAMKEMLDRHKKVYGHYKNDEVKEDERN